VTTETVEVLAREIQSYLASHPDAVDSEDGVLRWWLSRQWSHQSLANVRAALDLLVESNAVVRRSLPDGRCVFAKGATVVTFKNVRRLS
jgi:hypothetical protein